MLIFSQLSGGKSPPPLLSPDRQSRTKISKQLHHTRSALTIQDRGTYRIASSFEVKRKDTEFQYTMMPLAYHSHANFPTRSKFYLNSLDCKGAGDIYWQVLGVRRETHWARPERPMD